MWSRKPVFVQVVEVNYSSLVRHCMKQADYQTMSQYTPPSYRRLLYVVSGQ